MGVKTVHLAHWVSARFLASVSSDHNAHGSSFGVPRWEPQVRFPRYTAKWRGFDGTVAVATRRTGQLRKGFGPSSCPAGARTSQACTTPVLDLEFCRVHQRIARHREIDAVRTRRKPRRLEVENIAARDPKGRVKTKIIVWVGIPRVFNRSRNRSGDLSDADGVYSETGRRQVVAAAIAELQ